MADAEIDQTMPYDIEFKEDMPKRLVVRVATANWKRKNRKNMKRSCNKVRTLVSPGKRIVICFWLTLIVICFMHRDELTVEAIVSFTPDAPVWAAAVMLCLFALKGCTLMMSGIILYAASGVAFSLPWAILINTAGTFIMTTIPFFIGRKGGERAMEALTQKYQKLEALRNAPRNSEFSFTFFLRVLGLLPCELVGMYLGACGIHYEKYICGTLLGLIPAIVAYAVIGEYAAQPTSPQFIIAVGFQAGTTICALIAAFLYKRKKRQ